MPQPLTTKVDIDAGTTTVAFENAFSSRPHLAQFPMQVIEIWSMIDSMINRMLISFTKTDIEIANILLQTVDSISARRASIRAAAQHVLPPNDFQLFTATMKTVRASEGRRHMFCHHIWAVSPQLPDELLLMDSKEYLAGQARYNQHIVNHVGRKPWRQPPPPFDWSKILVFTKQDFLNDVSGALRAKRVVESLRMLVENFHEPAGEPSRQALLQDPLISAELDRLQRGGSQPNDG